ncbi:alpha/beta hydrolase fold domain-containing protein [Fluviispira vulneris]|uniref:alpha/beta hydrolase fold domain-containing protein n=1 Tax=Fluviispira vulneris TaxID=2763012 RepID=UPI0016489769|nr:alpha/beta hydrolase fold domain-containing protein [Fluviispira vulneris]
MELFFSFFQNFFRRFTKNNFFYNKYAKGFSLETEHMNIFFDYYLNGAAEKNSTNPKIYPYYYNNFSSLPKTLIIAGECDPLRDDAYLYAQKCYTHKTEMKYYEFAGTVHGFFSTLDTFPEARISADLVCEFISASSAVGENSRILGTFSTANLSLIL